jgi:hypothetical protein
LNLAACGLIAAVGAAAYANTLEAPFVFDGLPLQERLRALAWNPADWFGVGPRTIAYFTYDLQYTLHGRWLPGFHAVNIAIHVVAALALLGAVIVTCRGQRMPATIQRDTSGIALVSALIFELHPLQTQAVTYLFQRFESLMGMFFLLAVLCFALAVRGDGAGRRRVGWLLAAWAAVILSIGSKEVGVAAPLVLLWYDRVFAATSWRDLWTRRWWFHASFLAVFAGGAAYVYAQRAHYAAGGILAPEKMSPLTYALTQPEVICRYLRLAFWPRGLCLDWAWPPADTAARIVPPLLVLLVLLGFTGWAAVRLPAVGFLLGSFFLILAPTSSFAPIIDLAFEHRMYLPLAPLAVLVVLTGRAVLLRVAERPGFGPGVARAATIVLPVAVAVALGVTTHLRNEVYRSGVTLWNDVVEKVPGNPRAYARAGDPAFRVESGRVDPSCPRSREGRAIGRQPQQPRDRDRRIRSAGGRGVFPRGDRNRRPPDRREAQSRQIAGDDRPPGRSGQAAGAAGWSPDYPTSRRWKSSTASASSAVISTAAYAATVAKYSGEIACPCERASAAQKTCRFGTAT